MDDTQLAALVHELELNRLAMTELTDALRLQSFRAQELTAATNALRERIEERNRHKGFWERLAG